jgi:hypothetical protein
MRVSFTADQGGSDVQGSVLACGAAGEGHYLTFQLDADESGEDSGIYLEYDDQLNGGYGCLAACRVSRGLLSVDLTRPLGQLTVSGFDVMLRLRAEDAATVRAGLRRIFRGHLNLFADDADE